MGEIREEQVDSSRKKHKNRKNTEPGASGGKENEVRRRKRTKDEILGDVGESEAVGAANVSKKEKRKKDRSSGIGVEEKNDEKEIPKHRKGGGDGKGVVDVLRSSEAEVLGDTCVPDIEDIDARSQKQKKKKDLNIVIAEGREKKKKSKHSRGGEDNGGIPNASESFKAEGLGDISVPDAGFMDAVSRKEKKKKGKSMVIDEDQKRSGKKRKRKDKSGVGDEEIFSEVSDAPKTDLMGDTSLPVGGSMDTGSKKEKRKKDKTRVTPKDQGNHVKERSREDCGAGRDGDGISEGLEASKTDILGHLGVPGVGSKYNGSKKDKKMKKNKEIYGLMENKDPSEDKKLKEKENVLEVCEEIEDAKGKKRKKKNTKDSRGFSSSKELSDRNSLVHSDTQERNEAVGDALTVEDQIDCFDSAEIVESIKERKKKKKADLGAASTIEQSKSRDKSTKKRKKERSVASDAGGPDTIVSLSKGKNTSSESSRKSNLEKQPKKVKFADNVEVFNLSENLSEGEEQLKNKKKSSDGLKRGIRFSREEDEIVRKAVLKYVEDHQLGDEGLQMVMKCKEHKELKNCWKEIGEALPTRPYVAVYYRAHILFERSESRKWTKEELDSVKELHAQHGSNWKGIADELGKHRVHVKDAYRRIRLANVKKGNWSQEEYQTLFDLVNRDLRMKAFMDKKVKHGMLRDNIGWREVSDKLSTRTDPVCCVKWYEQLTSPLVKEQKWADTDDYRLVTALVELDSSCEEDVDWDSLLEHRSGDVCRKRWREMVRHLGEHRLKPFSDQVDALSKRYCPDLLEVREAYASKPAVD